jgi:hypothetical protein
VHVHERFPPVSNEGKQWALSYDLPGLAAKQISEKTAVPSFAAPGENSLAIVAALA